MEARTSSEHERDPLRGIEEGDLGDQARRDRGFGRPQGRAAHPRIAQIGDRGVQGIADLDIASGRIVPELFLTRIVERPVPGDSLVPRSAWILADSRVTCAT